MNPDFDRAKQWIDDLKQATPYRHRKPAMVGGFEDLSRDAQVRDLHSFKTYAIESIAGWWTSEDDDQRRLYRHQLHSPDGYLYEAMVLEKVLARCWDLMRAALITCALMPTTNMLFQPGPHRRWSCEGCGDFEPRGESDE